MTTGSARALRLGLMMTTMLAPAAAWAQETAASTRGEAGSAAANTGEQAGLEEIVVTAQKRAENLQKVPISITALGTEKLDQLKVKSIEDYVKFLPAVSFTSTGPGTTHAFFRGVSSGEGSNHSASLPTVGVYLDEQPITTIQGELELHVYDLARVEALSGPQGTLYGASSEAGTIRLITNKPKLGATEGAVDLEVNTLAHGAIGGVAEGFVNLPMGDNAAIRMVGWYEHDGGYIDNVPTTLAFPNSGITKSNPDRVEKNYNDVDTYGGRATLRLELDDRWVVTPSVMAQQQKSNGLFAYDKTLGKLRAGHFFPENANDRWIQAALTIEGKLGSVDVTYAGSYLTRKFDSNSDYTDYSYFYDVLYSYTLQNDAGDNIDPSQRIVGRDRFNKISQELRFATDAANPFRLVGGLFYQRQRHNIEQNYIVDGLADSLGVPGTADNLWLTKQRRIDRDYALFGEASYDFTDKLTLTAGGRWFHYRNTLVGFFGFGPGYSSSTGAAACFGGPNGPVLVKGGPCTNLGVLNPDGSISPREAKRTDFTQRVNLTYKIDPQKLVYATWSRGFRPGGINRRGGLTPYAPDFLDNYELGFKTSWLDNKLRINGALYHLKWKGVQFSFLGANGLTEIQNAGDARINGFEYDIQLVPTPGLTITTAGSFNDAKLTENFCRIAGPADCSGTGNRVLAPDGQRLPTSARFKGTTTARYEQTLGGGLGSYTGHVQASLNYQTNSRNSLRSDDLAVFGTRPGFVLVDANVGIANDVWSFELFGTNIFDRVADVYRYAECASAVCGGRVYAFVTQPRKIGLRVGRKF